MENLLDISKQKSEITKNSQSARDFITSILDAKSFVETDAFLFTQNDLADAKTLGEGVVTGYGLVNGSPVYLFCQNFNVLKGGLGKAHAQKILKCMMSAERTGTPLISILHTAGARLGEGVTALEGYGEIMAQSVKLSGLVPQISIVKGECFGAMGCLTALSDFTYIMKEGAVVLGSPQVVAAKSNSNATPVEIGGADASAKNGVASFAVKTAAELKNGLGKLLSLLTAGEEDVDDAVLNAAVTLSDAENTAEVCRQILDKDSVLEISEAYAPALVTALGRLGGIPVGVIAMGNQKNALLGADEAKKAARFVRMLDCYDIPLISLVNCEGVVNCIDAERGGLVKNVAGLMYAVGEAGIPKISVVTGSAIGTGYTALASKSMGFDYALALNTARISTLTKEAGATVVYADEIKSGKNTDKTRQKVEEKYAAYDANPLFAAELGCVDNIVAPGELRQYLVSALEMLKNKVNAFPVKKHGNMPY